MILITVYGMRDEQYTELVESLKGLFHNRQLDIMIQRSDMIRRTLNGISSGPNILIQPNIAQTTRDAIEVAEACNKPDKYLTLIQPITAKNGFFDFHEPFDMRELETKRI